MSGNLLTTENLNVNIGHTIVCKNLQLEIKHGECWAILGRNGVGKTTLLHTLAGLQKPDSGELKFLEKPLHDWQPRDLAKLRSLMPQTRQDAFAATVLETILLGRHPHAGFLPGNTESDIRIAKEALKVADIATLELRDITTLSGGERARVAFAQMLVQQAKLMLLDEPTSHLDLSHQQSLLTYIKNLTTKNQAAMLILHDVNLAARYATHILMLYGDGLWETGKTEDMLEPDKLSQLYLHSMKMLVLDERRVFIPA